MHGFLIFILVVLPFISAAAIYFLRLSQARSAIVLGTGTLLAAASVFLVLGGGFTYTPAPVLGLDTGIIVSILDFLLLGVMMYYGGKLRSKLVMFLVGFQILALAWFELFYMEHAPTMDAFFIDDLTMVMLLIINIIGSVVTFYAIPYMKRHEEHLKLAKSRQPRFFFFLVLFLGAMNGLVMSNNLLWVYFFFEVTTFCCFALIAHDDTEIAVANGLKALWMNSIAGVGFAVSIIWAYSTLGMLELTNIIKAGPMGGAMLAPLALLCLAGMIKAAQAPLQGWLLGAMVAPTPVSALLHSPTMVKAGVYIVLRLSPAYAGTLVSETVGLIGAFTFVTMAALAMGQSNGKKILAYSTISNLGLIVACAGINTPIAITAAVLLLIFHAVSKGLLFMCVGTIDQTIGSKDVEAMRGLYNKMPRTALITILGVLTMLLPPFGVLLGKWMAIEAAGDHVFVVTMLAVGSALTVVYWARWAGILLSAPFERNVPTERQGLITAGTLGFMGAAAVLVGLWSPWIYTGFIAPMLPEAPYTMSWIGVFQGAAGSFALIPLFLILVAGAAAAFVFIKRVAGQAKVTGPYMCGAGTDDPMAFKGPMNQPVTVTASNYYMEKIFGEDKLTKWVNLGALALVALMIGGAL